MSNEFYDVAGNLCSYREDGSLRVQTVNFEPSMTIQSEKDSCDINKIVNRFKATGVMTNLSQRQPISGDFSDIHDFHSAMNHVIAAEDAFMALPSALRKRFGNDPGQLISFLEDSNNRDEAVKLGLVASPQASQMPLGDAQLDAKEGG